MSRLGIHLAVESPGNSRRALFPGGELRIGRHADNELVLADKTVSRKHCLLRWRDDEELPHVEDLGSTSGVKLNGVRIHGPESIEPSESSEDLALCVGDVELKLVFRAVSKGAVGSPASAPRRGQNAPTPNPSEATARVKRIRPADIVESLSAGADEGSPASAPLLRQNAPTPLPNEATARIKRIRPAEIAELLARGAADEADQPSPSLSQRNADEADDFSTAETADRKTLAETPAPAAVREGSAADLSAAPEFSALSVGLAAPEGELRDEDLATEEDDSDGNNATREEHELIGALALALKSRRQYPTGHPLALEHGEDLRQRLCDYATTHRGGALLVVREGRLEINGRRLKGAGLGRARLAELVLLFDAADVAGLLLKGKFSAPAQQTLIDMFLEIEQVAADRRCDVVRERAARIRPPAHVAVLSPREVRELRYRADDADLSEEELAVFYYARVFASIEASHAALRLGRSPDMRVRELRTSLMKTIELLRMGIFEQRLLALTAVPYPKNSVLAADSTNVCFLALAIGRQLGLGRGGLADLGFAALYSKLGHALLEERDTESRAEIKKSVVSGVGASLRTRGFGDAGLLRLVVAHEHLRQTEHYPRAPGLPPSHAYSLIVGVAAAFEQLTHRAVEPLSPREALKALRTDAKRYEPELVAILAEVLGHCPRGTFLRLETGHSVIVVDGGRRAGRAIARTLVRADGSKDPRSTLRPLSPEDVEAADEIVSHDVQPEWWRELVR